MTGSEQVLINDWCQQFPSHSIGSLKFGPDGALYVTGGDGASFNYVDSGQTGNPCGDPPGEGGALRSQDVRTPPTPPRSTAPCCGSTSRPARASPTTRSPAAPTPTPAGSSPTGCATRSGRRSGPAPASCGSATSAGTRGRRSTASPRRPSQTNFGWPCYEGWVTTNHAQSARQSGYDNANLSLCESLYTAGQSAVAAPWYTYDHAAAVASGDGA